MRVVNKRYFHLWHNHGGRLNMHIITVHILCEFLISLNGFIPSVLSPNLIFLTEDTFAQQFFYFMRKTHNMLYMSIPEIKLDLGATVQPFAPSSVGSSPNKDKDKYPMDDIMDPIPCTLMYVKGRISRTIEVAEANVMHSRILHGRHIPAECAVVDVTMIKEGYEFEDHDYPDEDEGIEKLVDAKGTFILSPHKDIIVKNHLSSIVSPRSTEVEGTPT
jgi:hypothetical protein